MINNYTENHLFFNLLRLASPMSVLLGVGCFVTSSVLLTSGHLLKTAFFTLAGVLFIYGAYSLSYNASWRHYTFALFIPVLILLLSTLVDTLRLSWPFFAVPILILTQWAFSQFLPSPTNLD
jgi:hypothetical protein